MIILLYHNVIEHRPSAFNMLARPDWLTADEFEEEVASLAERFDLVCVDDIADAIRAKRRIPRACAITFDDGYAGAANLGLSILEGVGAVGAMFVVTGRVADPDTADAFDEAEALLLFSRAAQLELAEFGLGTLLLTCDACKLQALKAIGRVMKTTQPEVRLRLLDSVRAQVRCDSSAVEDYLQHDAFRSVTWDELKHAQSRGHVVGSHGRKHLALSTLGPDELEDEVAGSRTDVIANTGGEHLALAYPFGLAEHVDRDALVATENAGYAYGLTAIPGDNDERTGMFELRRATFRQLRKIRVQ